MSDSSDQGAPGPAGRRQLLKAGVWSVPAIAVVVAAPAYAASAAVTLRWDTFNVYGADYTPSGQPASLESKLQVQHVFAAGAPTLTGLTVSVAYPDSRVNGAGIHAVVGSGWAFTNAVHAGPTWLYTFTYTGSLPPGGSTSTLTYRVTRTNNSPGRVTLLASASAVGASPVTATASYDVT